MKTIGARLANGNRTKGPDIDADAIRELAELLGETGLTEIEIERNGARIRVARHAVATMAPPVAAPVAHAAAASEPPTTHKGPHPGAVPSPMVGTVYVSPEPGKPPFVKVGDEVKEGDTLLIVEAMKTMNPITAPRSGKIHEICVTDAQPVEFGQTLLIIA
jgi:acetyl-CoA carboxylase biotin carboxyl carrier protein